MDPFSVQPLPIFVVEIVNSKNNYNEKNDSKISSINSNGKLIF